MNADRRHALVLAAGMGASALLAAWLRPAPRGVLSHAGPSLDDLIPARFGVWALDRDAASFVRAADRRGRQTAIYDQVLERTFLHPSGQRVMLSLAYLGAQSSDMQLHRPEVCYRAGGFRVGEPSAARLQLDGRTLPVTRLVAEMPGRPEPITYWTVVGGRAGEATVLPWSERLHRALQREDAEGVLVRISSIDPQAERAYALHGEFAADLARALAPDRRDFVLGLRHPE
jgi:EpsI family protein